MNKTLLFAAIVWLDLITLNSQAQLNNDSQSQQELCSVKSYLPVNNPRIKSIDFIVEDKVNNMLFSSKNLGLGISSYNNGVWNYIDDTNFLPTNTIYSIFVDSKKNTWIGTSKGLVLFDGTNWITYSLAQFGERYVNSIAEDKNGKLWFFNYNDAVTFDGVKWELVNLGIDVWVQDPVYDKNSNLWFHGSNCVWKYDGTTATKYTTSNGLNSNSISGINVLDGDIYCFYYNLDSISKFETDKWVNVNTGIKSGTGFRKILKDKSNKIWLMSNLGGIYMKDEFGWKSYFNLGIYGITSMFMDGSGDLWFGNRDGQIVKLDSEGPQLITKMNNDGIGFIDIKTFIVDKNNKLWVHSSSNFQSPLSSFDGKNWINFDNWFGYNTSFAIDKNDTLYACSGSIYKYDGKYWRDLRYTQGINYNDAKALIFDNKNQMWFAWGSDVIVRISGNNITEFKQSDGILNQYPKKIVQDKDSNIWVLYGNYETKVSKYDGKQWTTVELPKSSNGVFEYSDAVCDTSGNMWFGSFIGLVKYDRVTKKLKSYNTYNSGMAFDYIISLYLDKNNNIWCGGANSPGSYYISKLVIKDDVWKNYPALNKNYSHYNLVTGDNQNNIYVGDLLSGLYKLTFNAELPEIIKTDIVCTGAADGSLKLRLKKDISQLYSIDNGLTFKPDTMYNQLLAGTYSLKAKMGSCVTEAKNVTIAEPTGSFTVEKKDLNCNGNLDGSISITTQGLNDIEYLWNTGATASSITNMPKGNYSVTVKHSGNCNFERKFELTEPETLSVTDSFYNVCGHKGAIYLSVKGGTEPYKFSWSNNKTTPNIEGLDAGNYTVNITDNKNCSTAEKTFTIASFPEIQAKSIIIKTKDYLCGGSSTITANQAYKSYAWFKRNSPLSNTTNSFSVTDSGLYIVQVNDVNKCYAFDTIKILQKSTYDIPQICLVTVDESTNKNKIIWNKFKADSLVKVVIEKESNLSGVYSNIGIVDSYQNGFFIDQISTPQARADRYRIRVSDECNSLSQPGNIHKTMHLTASIGSNNEVNLVWSGYEGFTFGSYNIYRGPSKSNMSLLTTIQSNLNSYTDLNPPSGSIFYFLEAVSPDVCSPDALKSGNSSTRSNFADNGVTSSGNKIYNSNIEVSPNPSQNGVKVKFGKNFPGKVNIKLIDMTGKILYLREDISEDNFYIERNDIPSGIYTLVIEGDEIFRTKLIFQ